jgi:hypothetical protein
VLISAAKGWFLARAEQGAVTVNLIDNADTGPVFTMQDLPSDGALAWAEKVSGARRERCSYHR